MHVVTVIFVDTSGYRTGHVSSAGISTSASPPYRSSSPTSSRYSPSKDISSSPKSTCAGDSTMGSVGPLSPIDIPSNSSGSLPPYDSIWTRLG